MARMEVRKTTRRETIVTPSSAAKPAPRAMRPSLQLCAPADAAAQTTAADGMALSLGKR